MHGRGGEERKRARHMWTTPTRGNPIVNVAAGVSPSKSVSTNYFFKVFFFVVITVASFQGSIPWYWMILYKKPLYQKKNFWRIEI